MILWWWRKWKEFIRAKNWIEIRKRRISLHKNSCSESLHSWLTWMNRVSRCILKCDRISLNYSQHECILLICGLNFFGRQLILDCSAVWLTISWIREAGTKWIRWPQTCDTPVTCWDEEISRMFNKLEIYLHSLFDWALFMLGLMGTMSFRWVRSWCCGVELGFI